MKKTLLALLAMLLVATDCRADNCDAIKASIESRFRVGGLADVALAVVDVGPVTSGRIVGTCANGAKQIVVTSADTAAAVPLRSPSAPDRAAAAPDRAAATVAGTARPPRPSPASGAEPAADRIPTECKDGSIVLGPDCSDPRAARLTKEQLSELTSGAR
jgi:hypothetical protein